MTIFISLLKSKMLACNKTSRIVLGVIALVACFASSAKAQYIIAHRGASYDAPENTLAAFRLAWEQGADGVEGDFYLSSDGRIVCIHDRDTKRVAGIDLKVAQTTYEKLCSLDVGTWRAPRWKNEKIPSISEVFEVIPPGKKIFIELKVGPEIVEPLKKAIEASQLQNDQIVIISFHANTLAKCEKLMPQLRTHWLTGYKQKEDEGWVPKADEVARTIISIQADGLGSNAKVEVFNRMFINRYQATTTDEFHVWTVNDPAVASHYQELGAWSITTDRPGWLRKQLDLNVDKLK